MTSKSAPYAATGVAPTSSQVDWWSVHCHVEPMISSVSAWPMAGTLAWQQLDADDPAKVASLMDAARHWALRVDSCQEAMADASRAIAAATDWSAVAVRKAAKTNRIPRSKDAA